MWMKVNQTPAAPACTKHKRALAVHVQAAQSLRVLAQIPRTNPRGLFKRPCVLLLGVRDGVKRHAASL